MLCIERRTAEGTILTRSKGEYTVSLDTASYNPGDYLVFRTGSTSYVWIQPAESVTECLLYVPTGVFAFPIPNGEAMRGFAPGTFDGPQTVTMRLTIPKELRTYRNLCLNTMDFRLPSEVVDPDAPEWSNPTDSQAIANGEVLAYPHVYANRVTRNEGCFYARNAIDGICTPGGHGSYPYHSWGGAVHEDLTLAVYFGREVQIDKLVLYLRSDYTTDDQGREHDTYWHTALVELSDGYQTEIHPQKSAEGQVFDLGKHTAAWAKLSRLDPLQHEGSLNYAALNQIEIWGNDLTR